MIFFIACIGYTPWIFLLQIFLHIQKQKGDSKLKITTPERPPEGNIRNSIHSSHKDSVNQHNPSLFNLSRLELGLVKHPKGVPGVAERTLLRREEWITYINRLQLPYYNAV